MKIVIAVLVILAVSFFLGMVLGLIASDEYDDDKDQEEYLRRWSEKHRKRS